MAYIWIIGICGLLIIIYMVYLAHHDTIDYRTVNDENVPAGFDSFRIFFISDIHRRNIKQATLNKIDSHIDLIIIGGDLRENGVPLKRTRKNLDMLKKWNKSICFIWGNNDYEENPVALYQMLQKENITILANDSTQVKGNNEQYFNLVGLDCCKYKEARFDLATKNMDAAYTVLVTHAPSAFENMTENEQDTAHLVLAGHTHGGQIRIFGYGFYERGSYTKRRNTNILISEGYGYTGLPFRLGTKSECHVLTFEKKV
ncbi:metallophosphoesterase [Virgibacillus phasianinus]|uniref:Metallophosphoesterase n=1 Tax=Virgibacillus phasianinus TaxID=2017483 RepID=A0A220U5D5_9BACI|nr:metallophosphoesterase family protein [Virgibacillus phasianinus]ASK63319.1 metallophosphoesterase [Virgibacillus phasianinus]